MSTKARKIPALPYVTGVSNNDLIVIEKVANSTSSVTSKVPAQAFVEYLITSPLGFANVAGDIIPASNNTYNIGSNTNYWNNVYVGNTVYIGNSSLTINANGTLVVDGSTVDTDRLTSNGYNVILNANGILEIPGTISSANGITLSSDRGSVQFGANLEAPGAPTHYHINKTVNNFDLFLGDDSNYVELPQSGGVVIGTQGNTYNQWNFGVDGTTNFPNNTIKSTTDINVQVGGGNSRLWYNIYGEINNFNTPNVILNGSVTYDGNNNIYVLGSTFDINNSNGNNLFLKYTPDGQLVWHRTWSDANNLPCGSFNAGMRFQPGTGGNIDTILFTSVDSNAQSYVGTIDLDGNLVDLTGIARTPLKISNFRINDIIPYDAEDNAFIVGRYYDANTSASAPAAAIISLTNQVEPTVFVYYPTDLNINSSSNYLKAIDVVSNTNIGTIVYSVGSYNDNYLNGAVLCSSLITEMDVTHNVYKIGNNHEEYIKFEDSCSDANSNVYGLLSSEGSGVGTGYAVVVSTNLFGNTTTINRWQKKISINAQDVIGTSIAYHNNYVYVLTKIPVNNGDIALLKLDATSGAIQWARNIGSSYYEDFWSIDGGYSSTDLSIDSTGTYITFTAYTENTNSGGGLPANFTVQYTLDGSLLGTFGNFVFSDSTSTFVIEDHDFNVIDITSTTTIENPVLTIANAAFLATTVTVDAGWANLNQPLGAYDSTWTFGANSALSVPGLIQFPTGTLAEVAESVPIIIDDLTLSSTIDFSTGEGDNLATGDYGLTTGVSHPWIVYQFTTPPFPPLSVEDVISGVGIPVGSTVIYVGTGAYETYVITNVAQPNEIVAQPDTIVSVVRPIINASLGIETLANTNIVLAPGSNGVISSHSSIIPDVSNVYDLGSPLRRFKTLWLGGASIYIVDETLGVDQRLTAIDGNFVVAGGAGMKVGEFTLRDNNILLANTARDINIGSTGASGHIIFKRTVNVRNSTDEWDLLKVDQAGTVSVLSDIATDPTKAAMSIVSARTRDVQAPNNLGVLLQLTGSSTAPSRIYHDSFGTGNYSAFIGRHARGNSLTPSQVLAGDIISRVGANPYGTDAFSPISTMRMDFVVRENQTTTNQGSEIQFWTTAIGANTIVKRVTINEDGLKFADNSTQSTAFSNTSAVTRINVGTGLTQTANVGVIGIDSTAVLSVAGTANQISVANVGGNYTLSLPQNLNTTATVQFDSLTVNTIIITGESTIANSVNISDKIIHLAIDSTANTQIDGGGFTLGNTSSDYFVSILYDLNNDRWDTNGAGLKTLNLVANDITVDSLTSFGSAKFGASYLGYDFTNAQIQADADINSYAQIVIKNHSNGTDASSDIIATNDLGDDSNYYIDMGINSSTYSNPDYNISGPNGGYLYNVGGDLAIGTATPSNVIKLFTGGTTLDKLRLTIDDNGLTAVGNVSANTFIGNLSGTANNALYLGGVPAANYINNTGNYTLSGNVTFNSTISVNKLAANGYIGSASQVLTSNSSGGVFWANNTAGYTGSQGVGYTGSASTVVGYTGSQGTGYTGSQGIQGTTGFAGSQGVQGNLGYTGSQGIQGVIGFTGSVGSQGITGFTGSVGFVGSQGAVGFTGSKGTDGLIGYTGSIGTTGFTGSQGIQGTIGYTGSKGLDGLIGYTGSQGIQGITGFTGSVGFTGSRGITGFTGSVGFTGSQGITGFTGSVGFTGSQGIIGFTGSVGVVDTSVQYTWSNTQTFNANAIFNSSIEVQSIIANSTPGTAGQVLTSSGNDTYWSTKIPDEQVFVLAANRPLANQTSLQSALGVGVTLDSTTRYRYRFICTIFKSNTGSTAAVTYALSGTAGLARHYFVVNPCDSSTQETPTATLQMSANKTANFNVATTITGTNLGATYYAIIIDGIIDTTTGGTIVPEIGFTSTAGISCVIQAGASFEIYPVSATGSNTVVGNWV